MYYSVVLRRVEDYDSKTHKPIRFEAQCRNRTERDEDAESTEASSRSKRVKEYGQPKTASLKT